jgi:hypothetical protein
MAEVCDQLTCRIRLRPLDDFSNLLTERMDVLLGGFDQQLAAVPAHVLTEELEALIDMCDNRLFCREHQHTFAKEADVVETASDIAFQHPARMSCEGLEAALDRIRAGPPMEEPIGVFIRHRLCQGSSASRCSGCMAWSFMTGIPSDATCRSTSKYRCA